MNNILRIVKYLGGAILGIVLMFVLPGMIVPLFKIQDTFIMEIVYVLVINVILTAIIIAFGQKDVFKFSLKSFKSTFVVGGVMTAFTVYYLITNMYKSIRDYGTPTTDGRFIVLYLVFLAVGAGIREELPTRGFLMTFIQKAFGNSKASYIVAMAVSSIFFGLLHTSNLKGVTDPTPIYAQIIYAIGIGFFLAAVYLRTKNLWGNMVLHFLFDLGLMVYPYIYQGRSDLDVLIAEWLGSNIILKSIIITVVSVLIGLFLIRGSKFKEAE